jgi:hypothetical protein
LTHIDELGEMGNWATGVFQMWLTGKTGQAPNVDPEVTTLATTPNNID